MLDVQTRKLLNAPQEETLQNTGLRLPPAWLEFLRAEYPGLNDTEILRRIVGSSVIELSAGGEDVIRKQAIASLLLLIEKAGEILEPREAM